MLPSLALAVVLLTAAGVCAQVPDVSLPPPIPIVICPSADPRCPPPVPVTPPELPDTLVGYVDMVVKASPGYIPILITVIIMVLKIETPTLLEKVPTRYLPLVNLALSAGVSALTAWGTGLVMDGGVDPGVAAAEGGTIGAGAQLGANKVMRHTVEAPPVVIAELKAEEKKQG